MAATEEQVVHRAGRPATRGRAAHHRPRHLRRQLRGAGPPPPRHRAEPHRPRADQEHRRLAGPLGPRSRRGAHRRGSQGCVAERAAVHLAGVRRHQDAAAPAPLHRQGALRRRRCRRRGRGEPRAGEGCRRAHRGRLRARFPRSPTSRRPSTPAPRSSTTTSPRTAVTRGRCRAASPTRSSPRRPIR